MERIGHILQRRDHGRLILRARLVEQVPRRAAFVQKLAAVKDGLRQPRADAPEAPAPGPNSWLTSVPTVP